MPGDGPTLCPFALVTGVACPLCGMTRAVVHLAQGDFAEAVAFHPLVLLVVAALLVLVVVRLTGRRWPASIGGAPALVGVAALFMATWVVRLATGTLPPV
ncbi:MAG TPA: DUF2752 domain-containing protein [Acidimicrobiia bacterium]|nr:DUF2752 domain-containing protein [Acidimicrobiia bacterium]